MRRIENDKTLMTRDNHPTSKRIALLATGDEIINGDILNTNSQFIANQLSQNGIDVGMHMTATDQLHQIKEAISFLLTSHDGLIITGGLGPTTDDLTRYALAEATQTTLVFDDPTWENICKRLLKFGFNPPPESNRRQALFPNNAKIIPNPNGTAAGCFLLHNQKLIFMLPGPPQECLPMFDKNVLPNLLENNFHTIHYKERWLLFGVSEGQIAEELENVVSQVECTTGYRIAYPYIEFKLSCNTKDQFEQSKRLVENHIKPYLIGNGKQTASEQFKHLLANIDQSKKNFWIRIRDEATGGALQNCILNSETLAHLSFTNEEDAEVIIYGLKEYWRPDESDISTKNKSITSLKIHVNYRHFQDSAEISVPLHPARIKLYAVEWVCKHLLNLLNI